MTGHGRYTVLLIDDEQAGLELRKMVLESRGFEVLRANTPDDAMELFRSHDVEVVVTDHLLGRETAAGLAATMKRLKPYVPIVSLSGTSNVDQALRYADHFVAKAEGPESLLAMLDEVLAQRKPEVETGPSMTASGDVSLLQGLLAAIVEDSSDAILSKTLDGTVTSWNHAAELMYGYASDEIVGQNITMLLPPDRPDEVNHILSRLKRGERISHFETVRIAKRGRRLEVALTISPIRDGRGRLVGASTIARDITSLRKAEEALRKSEKLALAGRMAATVAHEINNPLEAIGNILYLLRTAVSANPAALEYIQLAQDELKRVAEITKLALGMQRGAAERRQDVQVTSLLKNVLTLYERKTKTLAIKVDCRFDFEGTLAGSPGELRQVFSNLVVNAMDAMEAKGSKLIISIHPAKRWDTEERGVRVIIADDGPGIPAEHRRQLFQPFYTTKGEKGTGIGLWVSKAIVKTHGGSMRMHSSVLPGRSGTAFSVFLPTDRAARGSAA